MHQPQIRAIIFDLDGTLLDTLEDIANSMNTVLVKHGFPTHSVDDYRYLVGDGAAVLVSRVLPEEKRNDETIKNLLKEFRKEYSYNCNVTTKPYDGVHEMLDALTAHGIKLTILSNKPDDFTKLCVTEFLPNWNFDIVFGLREGIPRKPDPTGALQIAGHLNIPPAHILIVGDTSVDMKTAVAAGMFSVGVLWGFRSQEELLNNGAQALIQRPQEILTLL